MDPFHSYLRVKKEAVVNKYMSKSHNDWRNLKSITSELTSKRVNLFGEAKNELIYLGQP